MITPRIISRSDHPISRKWISPNALRVLYRLKERGYRGYLVGGGVRDLALGREPKDFDIATDATPNEMKKLFRNCRLIGRRFRLAHVHFHDEIIEVATFRALAADQPEEQAATEPAQGPAPEPAVEMPAGVESGAPATAEAPADAPAQQKPLDRPPQPRMLKSEDGMILRDNVFGTPEEDALRRDFTVNALFYNIADYSIIDYVGGMEDLKKGLIRIIGDPVERFTEDPVRMVRAVRFAAMLGFTIEGDTYDAMLAMKDRIALASPARMYEEVLKLFLLGEGDKTFQLLRRTGLFSVLFPKFNEWLDREEDGYPQVRPGKALEWVDACNQAGRTVEPHMLFALMFGGYVEHKAAAGEAAGLIPLEALDKAVAEFLGEQTPRVQIPKKAALAMREIIWNQRRFDRTQGKQALYFLRRPGFADAFEYFRFASELTGERLELRRWWKDFIKTHAEHQEPRPRPAKRGAAERPAEAPVVHPGGGRTARPKRRRRRRSGKPATPAPQT